MRLSQILSNTAGDSVRECGGLFTVLHLPKRAFVYDLGDWAKSAYLIKRGRVRIVRPAPDGREVTIALLNAGAMFGEECLFGRKLRSTSAICMEASVLYFARSGDFSAMLLRYPQLALDVAEILSSRLRYAFASLEDLAYSSVGDRLMHLLDRLAKDYGRPTAGGVVLDIRLTHSDLASLIGTSRETVTTELSGLRRSGRVRQNGRQLIITGG